MLTRVLTRVLTTVACILTGTAITVQVTFIISFQCCNTCKPLQEDARHVPSVERDAAPVLAVAKEKLYLQETKYITNMRAIQSSQAPSRGQSKQNNAYNRPALVLTTLRVPSCHRV